MRNGGSKLKKPEKCDFCGRVKMGFKIVMVQKLN